MKNKLFKANIVVFTIAIILFAFFININAQVNGHRHRDVNKNLKVKKEVVIKRDVAYKEIIVKDKHFFYRDGCFYDRRPEGYVKVIAPIGARVTFLPHGYKIVRFHQIRYFVFGGIYYQFLPRERLFVVVKAPLW